MSNLTNIVIGLIVVELLLVRQLQARPAKETTPIRIVLILGLSGSGGGSGRSARSPEQKWHRLTKVIGRHRHLRQWPCSM